MFKCAMCEENLTAESDDIDVVDCDAIVLFAMYLSSLIIDPRELTGVVLQLLQPFESKER